MSETGTAAQYIADLEAKEQEWQDRCLAMQTERDALRQRVERPLDVEYTTSCGHKWTMRHTACPECFAALRQRVEELERENADLAKTWWESHAAATMRKRAEAAEAKLAEVQERLEASRGVGEAAEVEVARLREALLKRGLSSAPCDICGYNGRGYYQSDQHLCAALAPAKPCKRCGGGGLIADGLPCDGPVPCPDCAQEVK